MTRWGNWSGLYCAFLSHAYTLFSGEEKREKTDSPNAYTLFIGEETIREDIIVSVN